MPLYAPQVFTLGICPTWPPETSRGMSPVQPASARTAPRHLPPKPRWGPAHLKF